MENLKKPLNLTATGNKKSKKIIIFSHGFGVNKNGRNNLLLDIENALKDEFLCIRFDYNKFDASGNSHTPSISQMAEMLRKVCKWVEQEYDPLELNIIAHSIGCLVTLFANLKNTKHTILLAPPPDNRAAGLKEYFSQRAGTKIYSDKTSKIQRSDGTFTFVEPEFWIDLDLDPIKHVGNLAKTSYLTIVRAKQDSVIKDSYEGLFRIKEVNPLEINCDHGFEGEARSELTSQLQEILTKQVRRVALIVPLNDRNEILIQDRHNLKSKRLQWGWFGGGIEKDEEPLEAVIRETYEELGVKLKESDLKYLGHFQHETRPDFILKSDVYLYRTNKGIKDYILQEGDGMKYVDLEIATNFLNSVQDREIVMKIIKYQLS